MPIQAHLFQSFLYTSKYRNPNPDYNKGKECLANAYEEIQCLSNEEEKTGYFMVAKCNEAYMTYQVSGQIGSFQATIQDLSAKQTKVSQACIDSVRAFALSRVGPIKYDEAIYYFRKALEIQPDNTQWLFRLAVLIGRCSRIKNGLVYTPESAEEKGLYLKVIALDKNQAMAHAMLAYNYQLEGNEQAAIKYARRAEVLQPKKRKNPHVFQKVGKVFRRAGKYEKALQVLQKACAFSKKSSLFHEVGLVYRDMHNHQTGMKTKKMENSKPNKKPHIQLQHKAIEYYTYALDANPTNNMACLDKALAHQQLNNKVAASRDFIKVLTTKNLANRDKVIGHIKYACFLEQTCQNTEEACEHFKAAIECAVQNCTTSLVTRKNPKPNFEKALKEDLQRAKAGYKHAMKKRVKSDDPELHYEGLKGLAWLHQVFGEHAAARDRYEEYLRCDGKSTDDKAIYQLVKSLIQLGDFDEARKRTQDLQNLNKTDLAKKCTIQCALLQGEDAMVQGQVKLAKNFFREAVEAGSIEGGQKLAAYILLKDLHTSSLEFRIDCAKVLHCCEQNLQTDLFPYDEMKSLIDLEHAFYGKLRRRHLNLEKALLETSVLEVTPATLSKASEVMTEARFLLDRAMSEFQHKNYPDLGHNVIYFLHIRQDNSKVKRTVQELKDEMLRRLIKQYKWEQFDTRFPDLLDFLVKVTINSFAILLYKYPSLR